MKNLPILLLLLLALVGLIGVQTRFLWMGMKLELAQLESNVEEAMENIQDDIFQDEQLEFRLGAVLTSISKYNSDSSRLAVQQKIWALIEEEFYRLGITAETAYAITDAHQEQVWLTSENYDAADFKFDQFRRYLGNSILEASGKEVYLHLSIRHLAGVLIGALRFSIGLFVFSIIALLLAIYLLFRNVKQLNRLDQVKNDFINNLTHELNTPVFSISLMAKLLQQQPDKAVEYATAIEQQNNRLKTHIGKVLELASLQQAHYQLARKPVPLNPFLQKALQEVQAASATAVTIHTVLAETEDVVLLLDELHFQNVLHNLIENGIKYSKASPVIKLETKLVNNSVQLAVQDNGIGIAPKEQQKIFEKFYRVQQPSNDWKKGFGLGLSYVREILHKHEGRIWVESRVGEGSTFIIQLPMVVS